MTLLFSNDLTSLRHRHKEALILTDCPWAIKPLSPSHFPTDIFLGLVTHLWAESMECGPTQRNTALAKRGHQTAMSTDGLRENLGHR